MLIITTILHAYSILPLLKYYKHYTSEYVNLILISTFFSVLYHLNESNIVIAIIDYSMAIAWATYDVYFAIEYMYTIDLFEIMLLNSLIFLLNFSIPYDTSKYVMWHCLWHIISAVKTFYVSKKIEHSLEKIF